MWLSTDPSSPGVSAGSSLVQPYSSKTWVKAQSVPSASLLRMQKWEEWLIPQKAMPSGTARPGQARELGREKLNKHQQRQVYSPVPREE